MATFNDLPNELVVETLGYLHHDKALHARLACKHLARNGLNLALRAGETLNVHPAPSSTRRILAIRDDPVFAASMREINVVVTLTKTNATAYNNTSPHACHLQIEFGRQR